MIHFNKAKDTCSIERLIIEEPSINNQIVEKKITCDFSVGCVMGCKKKVLVTLAVGAIVCGAIGLLCYQFW